VSDRHETEGSAGIPSPLHALAVLALALCAMLAAGAALGSVAFALAIEAGQDRAVLEKNPRALPTFSSPAWIAGGTLVNEAVVALALYIGMKRSGVARARVLPLAVPKPSSVLAAVLLVFGLAPLADVAAELCQRWVGSDLTATELVANVARSASPGALVLLLFALAVVPALVEEAMFRGFVTLAFLRSGIAALVIPSVLFAGFHLEPTQAAGTLVLGFGFAAARLLTGSLLPSIIAHAVYNAAVIFTVRHSDLPAPGRAIEPLPVVIGLGIAALGLALLLRERRALATARSSSS
jgi:membrane protease YdiL (CAAX protease family)